jgi:hypothetical protein
MIMLDPLFWVANGLQQIPSGIQPDGENNGHAIPGQMANLKILHFSLP